MTTARERWTRGAKAQVEQLKEELAAVESEKLAAIAELRRCVEQRAALQRELSERESV